MRMPILLLSCLFFFDASGQKVQSIAFNLYTDSLKKGFYNYISVDGQLADGCWQPLDSTVLKFTANTGFFKGNDIFIDSSYRSETVTIKAVLKSNPAIWREVVIYIRKRGFIEPLKTNDEVKNDVRSRRRRSLY